MTILAPDFVIPSVVVFEREPYWEPELRRQFASGDVRVRACRSIRDLDLAVLHEGHSVAVVNLGDNTADLLRWMSRQLVDGRAIPIIVVGGLEQQSLEWYVKEAGAVAYVSEFFGGTAMARLCRKQWSSEGLRSNTEQHNGSE